MMYRIVSKKDNIGRYVEDLAKQARESSFALGRIPAVKKNKALRRMAKALIKKKNYGTSKVSLVGRCINKLKPSFRRL